jgi:glycosyltransferase involved in cell wall biosynthesis
LKILFLLTQDLESPSGLGRYFPLARELAKLGLQVRIAALHSNYTVLDKKKFSQDQIQVQYVGQMQALKQGDRKVYFPWYRLLFILIKGTLGLFYVALFQDADIIFICKPHPMNSLAGLLAGRLCRRRILVDCDDYEAASAHYTGLWQRKWVAWFENHIPLYVDHVTTHTNFMRNYLMNLGVSAKKITYIPNGIDMDRFQPPSEEEVKTLRQKYRLGGKKVVIFVGSLSRPSHPVDLLLDAFSRVNQSRSDCVLLLVGGGDELDALKERVKQMELQNVVCFTGRVAPQDVPAYYKLGDVSVDPVEDDDIARGRSPLKMFESWISGVPFITGDVGDRALLLGDPPAGLLVPPGDPEAVEVGIINILDDSELAYTLCSLGMERTRQYEWSKIALQMERIIRSAVLAI